MALQVVPPDPEAPASEPVSIGVAMPEPVVTATEAPLPATSTQGSPSLEASATRLAPPGVAAQPTTIDSPSAEPPAPRAKQTLPAFRTQGLPPARPPASARLEYNVSGQSRGMSYQATGTLDWQHDGVAYQAQMRVSAFMIGSRTQRSAGQLHATGLHPDLFTDISRRQRETRFDGEQARIGYTGIAHQDPLQTGAQDRLSIILQLASRFNVQAPAAGQRMSFQVVGASSAEPWEFEVLGQERVSVAAGEFTAWHVRRVAHREGDARLSAWLAPELDHLPVRLVLVQPNGDQLEQALRRLP